MNFDAKRWPQDASQGHRNEDQHPNHIRPAAGPQGPCERCCAPVVLGPVDEYVALVTDDVCEAASHFGVWHRWNEAYWVAVAGARYVAFVTGPVPDR